MAEAAEDAETPRQLINIVMFIITRSNVFTSDICKWNDKPDIEKTWPVFKNHFKAAQKAIRNSQPAVTADTLGFHGHANTIADQVVEILTQRDSDTAEQQMQQQLDNMANSTQQNQSMLD
jgi:hypothetical protein